MIREDVYKDKNSQYQARYLTLKLRYPARLKNNKKPNAKDKHKKLRPSLTFAETSNCSGGQYLYSAKTLLAILTLSFSKMLA